MSEDMDNLRSSKLGSLLNQKSESKKKDKKDNIVSYKGTSFRLPVDVVSDLKLASAISSEVTGKYKSMSAIITEAVRYHLEKHYKINKGRF